MQSVWKLFPREFTLIHRLVEGFNVTFYVLIIYPKSVGIYAEIRGQKHFLIFSFDAELYRKALISI